MRYSIFLLLITLLCSANAGLQAQTWAGQVKDASDGQPLAFVAIVIKDTQKGTWSDIDGYFELEIPEGSAEQVVQFRFLGYNTYEIIPGKTPPDVVLLTPIDTDLPEVVVRPGKNPAERIIQAAIDNKKTNDPETSCSFRYDSYNKLVFTARLDSALIYGDSATVPMDSSTMQMVNFFRQQHIMMMESVSQRRYMPPGRSEETIIANKVSGLKHPEFALLGTELQSFSVYAEEVSLLGQPYLSPVSNVAIDKYLFIIEDTTWAGTDTIFTLSFRPRKGVKTAAMKGQVFINTNGYAVQQVIAEAAEPGESFSISIRQQYEKIENRQWFPVQLNSDILFNNVVLNGHAMVGYGNCYLRNIELDPEYKAGSFSPVTLQLAKGATEAPDSLWDQYRQHPLDDRELKTYHVIDSLGDAVNLDEKIKIAEILMSGFVPMGPVDLDLKRILRFNDYEGLRLGIGLRTSEKFCSWAGISGYYAYGFRDKDNKYGGDVLFHINKKRNATLRLIHERDVAESSAPPLVMRTSFTDLSSLYPLFVSRMDRYEKTGIEIRGRTIRNITATWFGWRRSVETFSPYRFETSSAENVTLSSNRFTVFETGLGIRYAPGEKLARYGQKEIVLGGRFPVFHFRITTAVDLWDPSDFSFVRYEAQMDKTFRIRNTGDFTMRLFGGMVNDDVPLSWMFNMPGTYDFFSVATPMAFETARTNEFQHSAYGALFLRHSFRDLLFRIGAFRPHLVLVHNMATGKLEHPEGHSVAVHTVKSIFMESGIQIDQLIKSNFSGIGIGCFYRYGANHLPEFRDNFAIKLTVGYAL